MGIFQLLLTIQSVICSLLSKSQIWLGLIAKIFMFRLVKFDFLVKSDYLKSEKRTRWIVRVEKMIYFRLRDQTNTVFVLENISTKNSKNVLTAKSKSTNNFTLNLKLTKLVKQKWQNQLVKKNDSFKFRVRFVCWWTLKVTKVWHRIEPPKNNWKCNLETVQCRRGSVLFATNLFFTHDVDSLYFWLDNIGRWKVSECVPGEKYPCRVVSFLPFLLHFGVQCCRSAIRQGHTSS